MQHSMTLGLSRRFVRNAGAAKLLLLFIVGCVPAPRPSAPAPASVRTAPPPRPVRTVVPKIELKGTPRQGVALLGKAPADTQTLLLDGAPVYLAPDKRFIIAFDRDAPPSALLRATLADGAVSELPLAVGPGNWQIEKVNAPLLGGAKTSEEFQRRRADELAQIADARGGRVPSDGWQQAFIWPVKARISGRFGAQRIYQGTPGSYHSGVDLAGGLCRAGRWRRGPRRRSPFHARRQSPDHRSWHGPQQCLSAQYAPPRKNWRRRETRSADRRYRRDGTRIRPAFALEHEVASGPD